MKSVVLSGVSGGMGLATAKELIKAGYYVFGLDIKSPSEQLDNLSFIKTDLRDIKSIESAFKKVNKEVKSLSAIINMAGIYDLNSLVEMKEEDFIRIFDINVFAIYRLNKVFVPLLEDKGKIIVVSSELAPLDPLPFTGIYGVTKSTIEKYAYSLRMELQLLDYQVVLIRPGAIDTGLIDISLDKLNKFTDTTTLYQTNSKKFKEIVDSVENKKIPPVKVANLIYKVSNKKKPKYVYNINRNFSLRLLNAMPKRFQNWIIKKILKSKQNKTA